VHPILNRHRLAPGFIGLALVLALGCRQKVTAGQCDALIARYAALVVRDKMPEAPEDVVRSEQKRVREEATGDEGFRNCTTEVGPGEFACAMAAATPDAIEKCLE
jgi:hypothetical protein